VNAAAALLTTFLALAPGKQLRLVAVARPHPAHPQPRAIGLDIRGPTDQAAALRATLQELTSRRGLAFSFELLDPRAPGITEPWATLSVELEGAGARLGPAMTLREGRTGRVRLHRVVPDGASHQVTIETLATIAYTALETLALEEAPRPAATLPRDRPGAAGAPENDDTTGHAPADTHAGRHAPEPEAAPPPSTEQAAPVAAPPMPAALNALPSSDARPATPDADSLTVSSRGGAQAPAGGARAFPVRFTLASFAGYQAGNLFTGDRRPTSDTWGMGFAVAGAVPRWPLAPALGLGLGAWYRTGSVMGAGEPGPRPAPVPRLQAQAEVRLTVLRYGRFSAALGPWLTVSRTTYDLGPAPFGPRGPASGQGPPSQGLDPNAIDGPSRITRTALSVGLAARVEVDLGNHLALYCALAGATPLTGSPLVLPNDGRSDSAGSPGGSPAEARWTLAAQAGLSVAFTGVGDAF